MSTIVIQSFRDTGVPLWMQECMARARRWAGHQGFAYELRDDRLFDLVPAWYREKAHRHICVVTDLARLEYARLQLANGYSRVIWVDADVVITDLDRFQIPEDMTYGFSAEVWATSRNDQLICESRVNNAVCMFTAEASTVLDAYRDACLRVVGTVDRVGHRCTVGTHLLTAIHRQSPLPLLPHAGLLSPVAMDAIVAQDDRVLAEIMSRYGTAMYALNLCNFFRAAGAHREGIADSLYENVIGQLVGSSGGILNRYVPPAAPAVSP